MKVIQSLPSKRNSFDLHDVKPMKRSTSDRNSTAVALQLSETPLMIQIYGYSRIALL